ncbi:hypothetical protein I4U23_023295 [Adineta vaga]|nr:hypothetical protein I4U23_023295 [Adineta vaga]
MSNKQHSKKLQDSEIAVLKANSKLSEQEIRELYESFQIGDENGTGKINKEQFCKYYKQLVGNEEGLALMVENVFAICDANHDGSIDFTEFVLASCMGNKNNPDSTLQFAFDMIDISGDQHVSFNEVTDFLEKGIKLGLSKEEAAQLDVTQITSDIFALFGVDKGQKLNRQQFVDGCKSNSILNGIFGGGSE